MGRLRPMRKEATIARNRARIGHAAAQGHDEAGDLEPQPGQGEDVPTIRPAAASSPATGSMLRGALHRGLEMPPGRQPFGAVPAQEAGEDRRQDGPDGRVLGGAAVSEQDDQDDQRDQVVAPRAHDRPGRFPRGLGGCEVVLARLELDHEEGAHVVEEGGHGHHHHHVPEGDAQELHDEERGGAHEGRRDHGPDAAGRR